ncbi:MAG: hypothetical protein H5U38_02225 [Calditrichaeota bacterium]|nr:hypothetical protein [Calditrichota bacterium]
MSRRWTLAAFLLLFAVVAGHAVSAVAGTISPLKVTLVDSSAGAATICRVDFGFPGTLPKDGQIVVTFPLGFNVSGVVIAASPDHSIDGGFQVSADPATRIVTVTRDGTGSVKSGYANAKISLALLGNSTAPGSYTITLETRDGSGTPIDGPNTSSSFQIVSGPLHHFDLSGVPASLTAGSSFPGPVLVTAKDAYNNTVTTYSGTVSWSSTDPLAVLPATGGGFVGGQKSFSGSEFVLKTAGAQTVTVTDAVAGVSRQSGPITVSPGALQSFALSNPGSQVAGVGFVLEVSGAQDAYGNSWSGTIDVSFADGGSHLAPNGSGPSLSSITVTNGSGSAAQVLVKAESGVVLRGSSGGVTDDTDAFTVVPGALGSFGMTGVPAAVVAGSAFPSPVVVTAYDVFGNVKTNYTGQVYFTSTDPSATLPYTSGSRYTFTGDDAGEHSFPGSGFALRTAGARTITVTDGSISKESSAIQVSAGAIAAFTLNVGLSQVAGVPFALSVSNAVDSEGNPASGTVVVSVESGGGSSPNGSAPTLSDITVVAGTGSANQTLVNAVGTSLRGTVGSVVRTTGTINVQPGALGSFALTGYPAAVTAGNTFGTNNVTVAAYDAYGNLKTNYTGQVYFTSSDPQAVLPYTASNRYTFTLGDGGVHAFSGTGFALKTAGAQTVTVTDAAAGVSRQSGPITVSPGPLQSFALSNPGSQVAGVGFVLGVSGAQDAYGNSWSGTIAVSFADGGSHLAPNGSGPSLSSITVTNGSGSAAQVLVKAESGVVLRGSSGGVTDDTDAFTVVPGALGSFGMTGVPAAVVAGSVFPSSVVVTAYDVFGNVKSNYAGSVSWSSSDTQAELPPAGGGFSGGQKSFAADKFKLKTAGAQTVTVTDAEAGVSATSGAVTVSPANVANFTLSNPGNQTAGVPFALNISDARDAYGNPVSGVFTVDAEAGGGAAPDGTAAVLTPITVVAGSGSALQTLYRAETGVRLRAQRAGISKSTTPFSVAPGSALGTFGLTGYPNAVVAGQTFGGNSVVVTAFDQWENVKTDYAGQVWFTSTDANAVIAYDAAHPIALVNGSRTFPGSDFDLRTAGQQRITVTNGTVSKVSDYINVSAAPISDFTLSASSRQTAGQPFALTVSDAKDQYNNAASGLVTVGIASGGGDAPNGTPPRLADIVVVNGGGSAMQTLYNAVPTQLRGQSGSVTRTTGTIAVVPGSLGRFALTGYPTRTRAQTSFAQNVTVIAYDRYDNLKSNYTGQVYFTSSDAGATLPYDVNHRYTFVSGDNGSHTFQGSGFVLRTPGLQTIAVIDYDTGISKQSDAIDVYALEINSVTSAAVNVSQGQQGVQVTMAVRNYGALPVTITGADLSFFSVQPPQDRSADYVVVRTDAATQIPAGGTQSLTFLVAVKVSATPGVVTVDGSVSGLYSGTAVSAIGAASKHLWTVQTPPNLAVSAVNVVLDTVRQGQADVPLTVLLQNTGANAATARIDSVRFSLQRSGIPVESEYRIVPSPANPTTLSADQSRQFAFTLSASRNASPGVVQVTAHAYAKDVNTGNSYIASSTQPELFTLVQQPSLELQAIRASQANVTQGQTAVWTVTVRVQNKSLTDLVVDLSPSSTYVTFRKGAQDVTGEYTLTRPSALEGGGTILEGGGPPDSLVFIVVATGQTTGDITIAARVGCKDGTYDDSGRSGVFGGVTVQSVPVLLIDRIAPSQDTVTVGQSKAWQIDVHIRNGGGTNLQVDFAQSTVTLAPEELPGVEIVKPTALLNGNDLILEAGTADVMRFVVTRTGVPAGQVSIGATVRAVNVNSGAALTRTATAAVWAQTPADLKITRVEASDTTVTARQTRDWTVRVHLANLGQSDVLLDLSPQGTRPIFVPTGDHKIVWPTGLEGSGGTRLRGGATGALLFVVDETGSSAAKVALHAQVRAIEVNSGRQLTDDTYDAGSDTVLIQSPAAVAYLAGSLSPRSVNRGSYAAFSLRVRNSGGSTVILQQQSTWLKIDDGQGHVFQALLNGPAGSVIAPGDTTLTFVSTQVPRTMAPGLYAPVLQLFGTENQNPFSQQTTLADVVQVAAEARLAIQNTAASQPSVTQGQTRPWYLSVYVSNNGVTPVLLDSARVRLYRLGTEVTGEYTLQQPTVFYGSGTRVLAAGASDELRFPVVQTLAITTGPIRIYGEVWATEVTDPTNHLYAVTNTQWGYFTAQTPAQLAVLMVRPSQPAVTVGQTTEWRISVVLSNAGGSDLLVDTLAARTFVSFSAGSGWVVARPQALAGGGLLLEAGSVDSLVFVVTRSSTTPGVVAVTATVAAEEVNSGRQLVASSDVEQAGLVTVEQPAAVRLAGLEVEAPNAPFVNVGQGYKVRARVRNLGEEAATNVVVALQSEPKLSAIPATVTLPSVPGGQLVEVRANATAGLIPDTVEVVTARLVQAMSQNTGLPVTILPAESAGDSLTRVYTQKPAALDITSVVAEPDTVLAGQTGPFWTIRVAVRDTGSAGAVLAAPAPSNLTIRVSGQEQGDYVIGAPSGFVGGGLSLSGGQERILEYTVFKTGAKGGIGQILVELQGQDLNDSTQVLHVTGDGSFYVASPARVQIFSTVARAHNVAADGTAHVNVRQDFAVEVVVANVGGEDVADVRVGLRPQYSQAPPSQLIPLIKVGQEQTVTFSLRADSLRRPQGELFEAVIEAARGAASGLAAQVFPPVDATARAIIHSPARVRLRRLYLAMPNAPYLTSGEKAEVRAVVENLGSESVHNVRVRLGAAPGNALIPDTLVVTTSALGGTPDSAVVSFSMRAGTLTGPVTFRAYVDSAYADNVPEPATIIAPVTDSCVGHIQTAPVPQVVGLFFSQDTVLAESNEPWLCEVRLRNGGEAGLLFEPPKASALAISIQGVDQTSTYEVLAPSGLRTSGSHLLAGGTGDSYIFVVRRTGPLGGMALVRVSLVARDVNLGQSGPAYELVAQDSLFVKTAAVARVRRTEVVTRNVDPLGVGIVNTGQQFSIKVVVEEKQGREGLDSVRVQLIPPDTSFAVAESVLVIPFIDRNGADSVAFSVTAPGQERAQPQRFQVRVLSAIAHESRIPATVMREPFLEQALVVVQRPANLSVGVALEGGATVLTAGQPFRVVATVTNLGSAACDSGKLLLTPPTGYRLITEKDTSDAPRELLFELGSKSSTTLAVSGIAPAVASSGDVFRLALTERPHDLNTGSEVAVTKGIDTLVVQTVAPGMVVERVWVSWPPGATDDTLSTEQDFVLSALVVSSPDLAQRRAVLRLPLGSGYQLRADSVRAISSSPQTVSWTIRAPSDPDVQPAVLMVVASGVDGAGNSVRGDQAHEVLTVKRALLALEPLAIVEPAGAAGGDLSIGQRFKLQATVRNTGEAGTTGAGRLKLSLGETRCTLDASEPDSIKAFTPGASVYWWLRAAPELTSSATLSVTIIERPDDENTGSRAQVSNATSLLNVRTLDRGFVRVDTVFISEPAGAVDGTLSTGQTFIVTAQVTSARLSGDTLSAVLSVSDDSYYAESWSKRVVSGNRAVVQWRVEAPNPPVTTGLPDTLWVTALGRDWRSTDVFLTSTSEPLLVVLQRRADFRLRAEVFQPAEAARERRLSTGQLFQMRALVEVEGEAGLMPGDLFTVEMAPPGSRYTVEEPLVQSSSSGVLIWTLRAPATPSAGPEQFSFRLLDWPRDVNSGQRVSTPLDPDDKVAVTTVTRARLVCRVAIVAPADAVGGQVRVGQNFVVRAFVDNLGEAGYKRAEDFRFRLSLPSGYVTQDDIVKAPTGDVAMVQWQVRAPLLATLQWDTLKVELLDVGLDQYSEQKAEVADPTALLAVQTVAAVVHVSIYQVDRRSSAMTGASGVPLLGLRFYNPAAEGTAHFLLEKLVVQLRDPQGGELSPRETISRIAAVRRGQPLRPFVQVHDIPAANPLVLDFTTDTVDTLRASVPDSLELVVDLLPHTKAQRLMLAVDSALHVVVRDAESGQLVTVTDTLGNFSAAMRLQSDFRVVVQGEFDKAFGAYPNPFGQPDRPVVTFVYNLTADADVTISIYSLIGELVWTRHFPRGTPQARAGAHEGEVFWDGRNDRGQRVLNGIYIARIVTSNGQEAVTKIGVVH